MSERETSTEAFDEMFREKFAEPRNCNVVSAQMSLDGKGAFEILREFTQLWKVKYTDYAPENGFRGISFVWFGKKCNNFRSSPRHLPFEGGIS